MPMVSVITPTYESERFIAEAIRSVQAQTFVDWEMIIVDDASTDATPDIAMAFSEADPRIRLYRTKTNAGAGAARQKALDRATGRYIAFLDADDVWKPEKLEKQLAFMERTGAPFTFSFYDLMDESGTALGKTVEAPRTLSYRRLFFCNFIGNLTGIYDTERFGKIAVSAIRKRQDWMVWLTVLKEMKQASPVPESLATYRVRKDSISSSKAAMLRYNYAVYRRYHGFGAFVSMWCMAGFLIVQLLVKPRYIRRSQR